MNDSLSSLVGYLNSEASHRTVAAYPTTPVITLSREEGSGGESIAAEAGRILTARSNGVRPWLVLDDALAEQIIRDNNLPKRIQEFLNDQEVSYVQDIVEELLGLHPDRFTLVQKIIESILQLAKIGNVIFVGRAAHVVLMGFPEARHVRIVGTLEQRAERITAFSGLPLEEARARARKVDRARMRFIGHYFHRDIRDPHGYDMILNTDRLSLHEAARMVSELVPDEAQIAREGATVLR